MSEAQVTVTDGWAGARRETSRVGLRGAARAAPKRSLKDALSEAGLGDTPKDVLHPVSSRRRLSSKLEATAPAERLRSVLQRASGQDYPEPGDEAPLSGAVQPPVVVEEVPPLISASSRAGTAEGVVSPPPWVRAARRGRWRARASNAAGWLVTILVVGSIITLASRYLAVPPGGFDSVYTARN